MLKQRLITAAILIPLVIWGILALPTVWLAGLLALVILQGAREWAGFMQLPSGWPTLLYVVAIASCLLGTWLLLDSALLDAMVVIVLSLFWWLMAMIWVLSYPQSQTRWAPRWRQMLNGVFVLVPAWLAVIVLHGTGLPGPQLLLYLMALIWIADSGAYFGGRLWGRRKLAPQVSPGKTWEGALCAVLAVIIYSVLAAQWFQFSGNPLVYFVVLSVITVIFSIFGDLTESMFKRHAGMKDSGSLLPGHGGVLDRIDSITAAAPVFVVGLWLGEFAFIPAGV